MHAPLAALLLSLCLPCPHAAAAGDEAQCSSEEPDCVADEAGMLQSVMLPHGGPGAAQAALRPPGSAAARAPHGAGEGAGPAMAEVATAQGEELHLRSGLARCSSGVSGQYLDARLAEGAGFSLSSSATCAEAGSHGPNDCCAKWGSTVTASAALTTPVAITDEYTVNIDLSGSYGFLSVWGRAECSACGDDCKLCSSIPFAPCLHVPLPKCPIEAGSLSDTTSLTLPSSFPIPGNWFGSSVKLTGKVEMMNPAKETVASVKLEIKMSP